MKYKICQYVDGTGNYTYKVMYKDNWFFWSISTDKFNTPYEFEYHYQAMDHLDIIKRAHLMKQKKLVKCENWPKDYNK